MIFGFITLVAALLGLIATSSAQGFGNISDFATESTNSLLRVYAVPVGQGDCTFIKCPNGNIVVFDCGSSGGNRMTANEIQNFLGTSINSVVAILITHPHQDHYKYLDKIQWNNVSIRAVIIGSTCDRYGNLKNWLNRWNNQGKLYGIGTASTLPGTRCIGNCIVGNGAVTIDTNFCNDQNIQFDILAANVRAPLNQQSIVMKINYYNSWTMLLSGDMEGDASLDIANQLESGLQSTVYKMSHHGASRLANLNAWLTFISPQFSFASSGYNFRNCRHPRCDTINRLINLGTIAMIAPPHQFYCGNPDGDPSNYSNYRFNILETSPDPYNICLLMYWSSTNVQPLANCFLPTVQSQLSNDTDCDEEDDGVDASAGGTLPTIASIFVLTVATLLYFII